VVTRETLLKAVWGLSAAPRANLVEVHIRRLRAQLVRPGELDPIRTVRGMGYQLLSRPK
jgi:DNA-binding response OmpR family regulator